MSLSARKIFWKCCNMTIKDVVVGSRYRGQGLGMMLVRHVIDYARCELGNVDLHLTSRPERVAANECIRSWALSVGRRMPM